MKYLLTIWSAITLVMLCLTTLFKIMHYLGGNFFLLLTMGLLMPVLIILTAIYAIKIKNWK